MTQKTFFSIQNLFVVLVSLTLLSGLFSFLPTVGFCDPDLAVIDLQTQKDGQGPNQFGGDFNIGDVIFLISNLTYDDEPIENKLVGFEVQDSAGKIILDRTCMTTSDGLAIVNFTIWAGGCLTDSFGTWTAYTFVDVSEQVVNDTLTFDVSGPYIDVYNQKPDPYSGKGPHLPSDMFTHQEEVILYAEIHYDCQPIENKFVVFEVRDPNGEILIDRTSQTDEYGIANTSFRIESTPVFGEYTVLALVEISGEVANDTLSFDVGWVIELIEVINVNENGIPQGTFVRGEQSFFNFTVINNAWVPRRVTFTFMMYDEQSVPISHVILPDVIIAPGMVQSFVMGNPIPNWAYLCVGTAFANCYTDLPDEGGIPWCPEKTTTYLIVN